MFGADLGSAGLCVPASIVYGLAQKKPVDYVDAVTKLMTTAVL